jgi:hypothetical protein
LLRPNETPLSALPIDEEDDRLSGTKDVNVEACVVTAARVADARRSHLAA